MRITIIGCGAMGSVYAGLLADAGNELIVVDPWQEHMDAISEAGLRVEGISGDRTVKIQAMTEPDGQTADLVILAVKSAQVEAASIVAQKFMTDETDILTIQNGLGAADVVALNVGADRLIVGIASAFGSSFKGPGHVHHNGMEAIRMGGYSNIDPAKVENVAQVWREAGFNAEAVGDVIAMQWEKLICNVAYSGPCTLVGLTMGAVMDSKELGPISRAAAIEAWKVAKARGIGISVDDPVAHITAYGQTLYNAKPSVLLDYELKRKSEIDYINGAIPREAQKAGLTAPINETLTQLITHLERGF